MSMTGVMRKINAAINRQPQIAHARRASIFISYGSADAPIAAEMASKLDAAGFSPWWDSNLIGGDHFRKAIFQALDEADAVVVIWSSISVDSKWVEAEATRAMEQGKLIPVRLSQLDTKSIPAPFGTLQTLRLDDPDGLVRAITRLCPVPGLTL